MNESFALVVLADVVARLEKLGSPYALGGSAASGVWGQPRYTNDFDINVALSEERGLEFLAAFTPDYLISESELLGALAIKDDYRMVQALHVEHVYKIDFFLVGDEPFGQSVLDRAKPVVLAEGLACMVQTPEDIVLNKLRWYESGNRASERQWNDAVQVLEVQASQLDVGYLREWATRLDVQALLEASFKEVGLS
ncbi:MAG: hypothetical protein M9921_10255 [Fimbriimonadaceae bacterium]|nr:hypothetical protein [Chthonomonadaceae bacterium]MCO5297227.1 hypothetical protein [Fimbriimonadaceae bacterium]